MKSLSYVCSGLFCKPILCFCFFSCGIRVASKSNVDSIPFPSGIHIFLCEYQPFSIIEFVMSILVSRCDSLQDDPIIRLICLINSKSSQRWLFHSSQAAFVFPAHPPFFFKDSDFLIKYPSYRWEVSPFFSVNVLTRWFS